MRFYSLEKEHVPDCSTQLFVNRVLQSMAISCTCIYNEYVLVIEIHVYLAYSLLIPLTCFQHLYFLTGNNSWVFLPHCSIRQGR